MDKPIKRRYVLDDFRAMKRDGRKFAMLTAYDYPTAAAAQAVGVPMLLIGDSMGCVLLGHENTRGVPLELMITLGNAVRRGAPRAYLVGDVPYECTRQGITGVLNAANRFRHEAGCDAVKVETPLDRDDWIQALSEAGFEVVVHLGLQPQSISTPKEYRTQARTRREIDALASAARRFVQAGAAMLLLEAVPNEAAVAVAAAVSSIVPSSITISDESFDAGKPAVSAAVNNAASAAEVASAATGEIPLIGCGAGPACDGHVCVTHDLLGLGAVRPPRFVPRLADLRIMMEQAMRRWVADIEQGIYPGPEHVYEMRRETDAPAAPST